MRVRPRPTGATSRLVCRTSRASLRGILIDAAGQPLVDEPVHLMPRLPDGVLPIGKDGVAAAPEGGHVFSRTLAEHERAAARLYASRR